MKEEFYKNKEQLNVLYTKFRNEFCDDEATYFVTISPSRNLFNDEEATAYLNGLVSSKMEYLMVTEVDDAINKYKQYKDYSGMPTLHFHLIIKQSNLNKFKNLFIYHNKNELREKKKRTSKQLQAVATKVFNQEGLQDYLCKQTSSKGHNVRFKIGTSNIEKSELSNDINFIRSNITNDQKNNFTKTKKNIADLAALVESKLSAKKNGPMEMLNIYQLLIFGGYTYSIIKTLKVLVKLNSFVVIKFVINKKLIGLIQKSKISTFKRFLLRKNIFYLKAKYLKGLE